MIQHAQGTLQRRSTPGPALYFYSASPEREPSAVVGLLPGYADHGGRWAHVMDAWAERGITSTAVDLRGHGRSGGRRGYCERFDEYLDDAAELDAIVPRGVPRVLFGHSFGGLVAASYVLSRATSWSGLAMTNPFFGLEMHVPLAKRWAGVVASRVLPGFSLPAGMRGSDMTHDAERARAYDEDPLVFKRATARWYTETLDRADRVVARAPSLSLPLYVVKGLSDPVASLDRARAFFDSAGTGEKTWDPREGLLHEVLNEPGWRAIADEIADFVLARAAARVASERAQSV